MPDFGDRFWVYALYDARTDEIAEIGKPYGTKPGFYMMVGPNWKGQTPAGITVHQVEGSLRRSWPRHPSGQRVVPCGRLSTIAEDDQYGIAEGTAWRP